MGGKQSEACDFRLCFEHVIWLIYMIERFILRLDSLKSLFLLLFFAIAGKKGDAQDDAAESEPKDSASNSTAA